MKPLIMRKCEVEGCNNKHQARGYCSGHYETVYYKKIRKNLRKRKPFVIPEFDFEEFKRTVEPFKIDKVSI